MIDKKPHPLALFRYCPRCGSALFKEHDARSKQCEDCGFTFYHNAAASTAAFIVRADGALLCARRACQPARGTLDLPGGFIDPGEDAVAGVVREVREETGAIVTSASFLFSLPNKYVFSGFEVATCDLFFSVELASYDHLQATDDVAELLWLQPEDIQPALFGLASIRQAVARYLQERGLALRK